MSAALMTERVTRTIPRFPGYAFDSQGGVWTCWEPFWTKGHRGVQYRQGDTWAPLHPHPVRGYLKCTVRDATTNRRVSCGVHVLILEAFYGACPPGLEGCHNNGNATDNRAVNLRWGTPASNNHDRAKHGVLPRGEQVKMSSLTRPLVETIRRLRRRGWSYGRLAQQFPVTKRALRKICNYETWTHVP
jgi:HNH endonuclease